MKKRMSMNFHLPSSKRIRFEPPVEESKRLESPFAISSTGGSFSLYLEPILNSYWKTYMQIITVNTVPNGPLRDLVMMISVPKLSSFQNASTNSPFFHGSNCVPCLMRYPANTIGGSGSAFRMNDAFMGADDIPSVLSYLESHGYTIQTELTHMLFEGNVPMGGVSEQRLSGNRKFIAMVRM